VPTIRSALLVLLFTAPLCALRADAQDVAKDVPPGHWAYEAVQDLASKGLIKGYPPDNNFLGKRTLTRYEMATILQRVLARVDEMIPKLTAPPPAGLSKEDAAKLQSSLTEIGRMVEEFKVQLTVIGTDMEKVKADLDTLKARVDALDGRIDAADKKATQAGVIADQALENINEVKNNTNAALAKKADVGVGKLRVSGLFQVWYGSAFGDTFGGNSPLNTSGVPAGRNYGGGVGDTFRLRRAEIALIGSITPRVDYRVMIDPAKVVGVNTTTTTVSTPSGTTSVVNSVTSNATTNILQDLWVGFQLTPRFRAEIGQQKTGLSEEGDHSSGQLLTVERSIMNTLPATVGRIGDIRDTGAVLRYKHPLGSLNFGIWDDNGATQNSLDTDRLKFADASAYFTGIRHLTLGVWGGTNLGDAKPAAARDRAGVTVLYQSGPHLLEAEGAYALDYAAGAPLFARTIGLGGYVLYAHTISRQWQLVGRYDEWDPAVHGGITTAGLTIAPSSHNLREYTLGVNYYLRAHNAKVQTNYIIEDVQHNGVGFFGKRRSLLLTNVQVAF
jgi:hypothetical protein